MDGKSAQLPWEALEHTEEDIPWEALYKFAAAVVTDPEVTGKLIELYEQFLDFKWERTCYVDPYIPAIFALAAPQLGACPSN